MIIEKNAMLNTLMKVDRPDEVKIHVVRIELDVLLYKYYKSLKYGL
jgi:hypothetical protein